LFLARLQLLFAILAIFFVQSALAQTPSAGASEPQPFFFPAPPAGFNPVGASDADLAAYGFPKRPALTDPYYATWAKVVSNAKNRIANPVARTTTRVHGPVRQAVSGPVHAAGGVGADNGFSYNWSGPEVTYPNTSGYFARNGSTAYIAFQPPVLGTEDCLYAPYHTSIWAGFDGDSRLSSYDVLQAGIDVSYGTSCSVSYAAWYEWYMPGCSGSSTSYPCYETDVNLTVNAGDAMYISVTYNTTSPNGTAFLSDQTTGDYVTVSFNQPSGNSDGTYSGSSAEWIVERPLSIATGSLYDLGNYSVPDGPNGYLWAYPDYTNSAGSIIGAGFDSAATTTFWTMTCDSSHWNPSSACNVISETISIPYYQQGSSGACIWPGTICFYPTGPAASQ
jgi:hypothetical protein